MADVSQAVTPQLVGDIVAACRLELAYWIPVLLGPLVEELKGLKTQSTQVKGHDEICAAPAVANNLSDPPPSEPSVRERSRSLPSATVLSGVPAVVEVQRSALLSSGDAATSSCSGSLIPVDDHSEPFPATAASAAAVVETATGTLDLGIRAPEGCPKIGCEDAANGDQQRKTEPAAPTSDSLLDFGDYVQEGYLKVGLNDATAGDQQRQAHLAAPANDSLLDFDDRMQGYHRLANEDAKSGDQQIRTVAAASMSDSPPIEIQSEMSLPLVDPAGSPEDCSVPREVLHRWPWSMWGEQSPEQREGYHLTSQCDTNDEPLTVEQTIDMDNEMDNESDTMEIMDPEAAKRLPQELAVLETKAEAASRSLEDLDNHWTNRRRPYEEDLTSIRQEMQKLQEELEFATLPKEKEAPPPGPAALKFIDSGAFGAICNVVVLLNLVAMIMGPKLKNYASYFKALDQVFLAWYVCELTAKAIYYQRSLIFGKISVVWWNWLDLGIVVSGIVDQWVLPLLAAFQGGHLAIDTSALRCLRLLRLFRIMRFLRIIKAFLKSDMAWAESSAFELWMAGVIAFNSVMMSVELDIQWVGWLYLENFLQIVYTFELALRLKRQCCGFFLDVDNMVWNYLDFIMVGGGALDLWLVPLIYALHEMFMGGGVAGPSKSLSGILRILKIMRILRVLRLVRLLKMVKPLYRLLIGVIASVKAMQWVMVLTFLTLYACSIVFTNLVGKGLMNGGDVSDSAFVYFGSVPKSLFSLFKLMNGEMSVVEPITGSITGQLLFAGFMVVSNWAILAILTAVVSDNMITTSRIANDEDQARQNTIDHELRIRRLTALFKEIDRDGEGTISSTEWQGMMEDRSLQRELCDATGLLKEDLNDYFECLAKDPEQEERDKLTSSGEIPDLNLDYQTFIEALKDEGVLADKRSILHVMKQLRVLENDVRSEFELLKKPTC